MRTRPPDLTDAAVAATLAASWAVTATTVTYAPVGFGSHHWLASRDDRPPWFVTADRPLDGLAAAFRTALVLRAHAGLRFVVAPVPTGAGDLLAPCGRWVVSVTPWHADAVDHPGDGPEVVDLIAQLHAATDSVRATARSDDLTIEARADLDEALATVDSPWGAGPYAEDARMALGAVAPALRVALAGYDRATARVDRARDVVTHGELKPGNLLTTPDGPALVDWETALLAPPERDLWRLPTADLVAYATRTGGSPDPTSWGCTAPAGTSSTSRCTSGSCGTRRRGPRTPRRPGPRCAPCWPEVSSSGSHRCAAAR